jgi:histidine triad (HIT) family protein
MVASEKKCVFCEIVQGTTEADKVYDDEFVIGFWNMEPEFPIHILIVPKKHIPTLNDVPADNPIMHYMGRAARKIAEQFLVDQSGYRFIVNVNKGAGQKVFHIHAHVIARKDGDV